MPGPGGTVLYINFLSPILKGADYTMAKILAEVFPQEVQQMFPLYRDAFAGLARAELSLMQDFGAPRAEAAGGAVEGRRGSGARGVGPGSRRPTPYVPRALHPHLAPSERQVAPA